MARGYPRFLYSDPQNTKSKGPFIIHLLYPKMICRIIRKDEIAGELLNKLVPIGYDKFIYLLDLLEHPEDNTSEQIIGRVMDDMIFWVIKQPEFRLR